MEPSAAVDATQEVDTVVSSNPRPEGVTSDPVVSQGQVDVEALIADNQRKAAKIDEVIGEKRKMSARMRDNETKVKEIFDGLGALLGVEQPNADPAELTRQLSSMQRELHSAKIEQRATAATYRAGMDPDIAVPVLRAQGKLDGIDLGSVDFEVALEAAVTGLAEAYPNLVTGGQAQVATVKPPTVLPTPSGVPQTGLQQQWEAVQASGNSFEIAEFAKKHGRDLWSSGQQRGAPALLV